MDLPGCVIVNQVIEQICHVSNCRRPECRESGACQSALDQKDAQRWLRMSVRKAVFGLTDQQLTSRDIITHAVESAINAALASEESKP